jgi:4-hydroxy-4-methyl-2-oxoglutarate aldolase
VAEPESELSNVPMPPHATTPAAKRLTGRIPEDRIRMLSIPRVALDILDGFRRLADLTGLVSDAMDELGVVGAIPASVLHPRHPGVRLVGHAITLRNIPQQTPVSVAASQRLSRLADIECHNLAEPGDVLVIQGVEGVSNMGMMAASIGQRQGEAGAVVDGAIRDVDRLRAIGYPVWSRSVSPLTGKYRVESVEVNGHVNIAGVQVRPGDLVVADDVGVCFVPRERAGQVLAIALELSASEQRRMEQVRAGVGVPELASATRSETRSP